MAEGNSRNGLTATQLFLRICLIVVGVLWTILQALSTSWVMNISSDVRELQLKMQNLETQSKFSEQAQQRLDQLWAERLNVNSMLSQAVSVTRDVTEIVQSLRFQQAELKASLGRIEDRLERRERRNERHGPPR